MSTNFFFEEVDNWDHWDNCVELSAQGTLFHQHKYLKEVGIPYKAWWMIKGEQICGGVVVQESKDGQTAVLDDLVIHNGIWFKNLNEQKLTKKRYQQFKLIEAAIDHLISRYNHFELSLSPQFQDLRPFLWHNYHEPDKGQFNISVRYTSYQEIKGFTGTTSQEDTEIFRNLETLRQRNLREAFKADVSFQLSDDWETMMNNYRETLKKSGDGFENQCKRMEALMNNLQMAGMGQLFSVDEPNSGTLYQVYFAWDSKRAYYLFGAGQIESKERYQGTFAFWSAMKELAKKGIEWIDWEGVNSPQRGWFKLSFGGELVPYYQLSWKRE